MRSDDSQARRGAWVEVSCDNASEVQRKIVEAGLPRIRYVQASARRCIRSSRGRWRLHSQLARDLYRLA